MKKGFTLAEVLITLSILGVVAAVIMPNVINNYKKSLAETRFKIIYSQLLNIIDMINVEYKPVSQIVDESYALGNSGNNGSNPRLSNFVDNYFEPYLKFTKKCRYRESGCKIFKAEGLGL